MHPTPRTSPRGFTLVEILVVIVIIALTSAVALPVILPALNERRVSESARVLQAVLSGARDAAIRAKAPRGIRLLPDPSLVPGGSVAGILASNRIIPIEPAPDYTEGTVNLLMNPQGQIIVAEVLYDGTNPDDTKQYNDYSSTTFPAVTPPTISTPVPANPTSWYWNVRQGDKIRFNDSGPYYTIAGPMVIGPHVDTNASATYQNWQNPERYINNGPPNATFPRTSAEFLILVNGLDDDENGYIDDSFDGIDNNLDGLVDPLYNGLDDNGDHIVDNEFPRPPFFPATNLPEGQFENEKFDGTLSQYVGTTTVGGPLVNLPYKIYRRPVVSPGARETTLPAGVVVDLTTWNAPNIVTSSGLPLRPERSRLPVDPYSGFVDIMIAPNGQVVQAGAGTSGGDINVLTPAANQPFYHFWLTEREAVQAPFTYDPAVGFLLPMPKDTPGYPATLPALTGERRLVTLFVKTGQIVSNSIQNFQILDPVTGTRNVDTTAPYYDAQAGIKETQ